MSHVASVDLLIHDLDALKTACQELGLEFREGQGRYKWYGHHVGDYPLPAGFKEKDLGTCEHAAGVPGNAKAYEIGLKRYPLGTKKTVKLADGSTQEVDVGGTWAMLFDFWQGGYGLMEKVGQNCDLLTQRYAVIVAERQAKRQGFHVQRKQQENGAIQLVCVASR
jgi:hypothetical protein